MKLSRAVTHGGCERVVVVRRVLARSQPYCQVQHRAFGEPDASNPLTLQRDPRTCVQARLGDADWMPIKGSGSDARRELTCVRCPVAVSLSEQRDIGDDPRSAFRHDVLGEHFLAMSGWLTVSGEVMPSAWRCAHGGTYRHRDHERHGEKKQQPTHRVMVGNLECARQDQLGI